MSLENCLNIFIKSLLLLEYELQSLYDNILDADFKFDVYNDMV